MEKFKNCQSCGMPLAKDPLGGGSNRDGSRSMMYCSNCFSGGAFTQPDWDLYRMQEFVAQKMKKMGFPQFFAKFSVKKISKLERWKNQ